MKDEGETLTMSALSRGGSGSGPLCPLHDEVKENHERRLEELRDAQDEAFKCISALTKHCEDSREKCQTKVWAAISSKAGSRMIVSFVGLALTIAVIIFTLYSSGINKSIVALTANDTLVREELGKDKTAAERYRKEMTDKVQDMYIMMIQLGGKPPKKNHFQE